MSFSDQHENNDGQPASRSYFRQPFSFSMAGGSEPPTPTEDPSVKPTLQTPAAMDGSATPARTKSILNLTSSTLFGIYQPTGYATDREEPSTPWGTGAQTPITGRGSLDWGRDSIPDTVLQKTSTGAKLTRRNAQAPTHRSRPSRRGFVGYFLPLLGRNVALSVAGVLYGLLITHLHDEQDIAPVKVDLDRSSWVYLAIWAVTGLVLGQALPWIDTLWTTDDEDEEYEERRNVSKSRKKTTQAGLEGWMDVVRSIGVFVGIAFAIRKLPWQSTLQLSLTLALSNPAVWYLIDRSAPGLLLSTVVALGGTALVLGTNPALIPTPSATAVFGGQGARSGNNSLPRGSFVSDELVLGMFSQEVVGVVTWFASVFFVSSVCFGNIGRRLAI